MTHHRLATFGLAAAVLLAATPAMAGNAGATSADKTAQVEQLGPKYLLHAADPHLVTLAARTTSSLGWYKAQLVEELGPKYLLGAANPPVQTLAARTAPISSWYKAQLVQELGPKYLLGR